MGRKSGVAGLCLIRLDSLQLVCPARQSALGAFLGAQITYEEIHIVMAIVYAT